MLPIKNPQSVKSTGYTHNSGNFRGAGGNYIPTIDPSQIAINYLAPGEKGVPVSTGDDPQDIYETDFAPGNQRNIFRQALQKRLDISIRKSARIKDRYVLQYNFDVYNLFNTTSLDVPQNQTQIRQNYSCSSSASTVAYSACAEGDVNYGQIATGADAGSQQSALTNLDQKPLATGSGKSTTIPLLTSSGAPNNGANFGSVTGTIGGGRAVIMGLHVTF